jgi:hypothetical protein
MGISPNATIMTLQGPKTSITSKEWVVPPRPKPGRKPATDTPPTKRKAQNRAAQRAFRERRAARVGELEQQLEEQRDQHDHVEQELRDRARGLELEVANLRTRCAMLEDLLEKERLQRHRASSELEAMQRWTDDRTTTDSSRSGSLPAMQMLSSRRPTPQRSYSSHLMEHGHPSSLPISRILSPPEPRSTPSHSPLQTPTDLGCGKCDPHGPCVCVDEALVKASPSGDCRKCTGDARCACLEAALEPSSAKTDSDLKRKLSSMSPLAPHEKRIKTAHSDHEIDFTAMFSKKVQSPEVGHTGSMFPFPQTGPITPRESCGFCKDGTYCVCAEENASSQTLAPMGHQVQTPPASDHDIASPMDLPSAGSVKLPSLQSLSYVHRPAPPQVTAKPAAGRPATGPGTCAQCLSDPKSGLFCRSLAASLQKNGGSVDGCCRSGNRDKAATSSASSPGPHSVGVSCADAYKTLSSHRNFEKAADEINSWLPQLRAVPRPKEIGEAEGSHRRPPIEVETASIMSVLKNFDTRFGREQ